MSTAGRKLFVGSLPCGIQETALRAEFSRFGQVEDVFIKNGCEVSRQWAFITMAAPDQAESAKAQCDRILMFPGAERPCDVMVAKNQGMFGQTSELAAPVQAGGLYARNPGLGEEQHELSAMQPVKIFVGSLPDGITDGTIRAEYSKYGSIVDVFVKPGCEPGRQWSFVSFSRPEEAAYAQEMTNGVTLFPGQLRGCEVTMARNQGLFGSEPIAHGPPRIGQDPHRQPVTDSMMQPKKVFVGSLPALITDVQLRAEFSKYGQVLDVHINNKPCEAGRNWAFITFGDAHQANLAKVSADRLLIFPGAEKACEVTLARHQGLFGQEAIAADGAPASHAPAMGGYVVAPDPYVVHMAQPASQAPRKIFVGSLPETITDPALRAEFSKFGQVIDVFVSNKPCEPGRNWAFVTFASPEQAQYAKDSTDRVLVMPGADRACEVMLAKNQGRNGPENLAGAPQQQQQQHLQPMHGHVVHPVAVIAAGPGQPPPPLAPPPAHLTSWRMYKTAAGLLYYHNAVSQVT